LRARFNVVARWDPGIWAALALALPIVALFLHSGLPITADSEIHLYRMASAVSNLQAGYLWPRWTPYLHQGYGYPIHNFYAPGLYIFTALVHLATELDLVVLFKVLLIGVIFLYPLGAYLLARRYFGPLGGLVAAVAYLYAPFRFHELFAQLNLAQFAAMALIPFLLWAISRAVDSPGLRSAAGIGLAFGAIAVLHHPTAFLVGPFAALFALSIAVRPGFRARVLAAIGGLVLGAALSAVFWWPALAELPHTQINSLQSGIFSTGANFLSLDMLLGGVRPVDVSQLGLPPMLKIGLPQWILAIAGAVSALRRRSLSRHARWLPALCVLVFASCMFLMTPAAGALWERLPLANLIVYPWRLLGVTSAAVLLPIAALPRLFGGARLAAALVILFFVASLPVLYTARICPCICQSRGR
jgi:uncharacterized membrane protein